MLTCLSQCIVGAWIPVWQAAFRGQANSKNSAEGTTSEQARSDQERKTQWKRAWLAAALLGSAMVARGEIGLLIIEIGHNETPYVSDEGFITAVWAILLNTIIGPVTVGFMARFHADRIGEGDWGLQELTTSPSSDGTLHGAV